MEMERNYGYVEMAGYQLERCDFIDNEMTLPYVRTLIANPDDETLHNATAEYARKFFLDMDELKWQPEWGLKIEDTAKAILQSYFKSHEYGDIEWNTEWGGEIEDAVADILTEHFPEEKIFFPTYIEDDDGEEFLSDFYSYGREDDNTVVEINIDGIEKKYLEKKVGRDIGDAEDIAMVIKSLLGLGN